MRKRQWGQRDWLWDSQILKDWELESELEERDQELEGLREWFGEWEWRCPNGST